MRISDAQRDKIIFWQHVDFTMDVHFNNITGTGR
jgi:hypothetical protein